jgi:predicted phosphate transport protein (TIGR00153 family)
MAFWKKQKAIETLVLEHLQCVEEAHAHFQKAFRAYLDGEDAEKAEQFALETHQAEGRADDVRRQVETKLLGGALLAHSRRDILEIIEGADKLANSGEAVLDYLLLQRVRIPEELKPALRAILDKTEEIIEEVNKALHLLFHDMHEVLAHTRAIETKEGEVDQLERKAIKQLFKMGIDLAEKIQIRGLVDLLVELSDRAEDLSDRIDIVVSERRL